MMLDELEKFKNEIFVALDVLIRQKEHVDKAYNKKVKVKTFASRDLVWKVILPMNKKD